METTDRDTTDAQALLEQARAGLEAEAERTQAGPLRRALTLLAEDPRRDLGDVIRIATKEGD